MRRTKVSKRRGKSTHCLSIGTTTLQGYYTWHISRAKFSALWADGPYRRSFAAVPSALITIIAYKEDCKLKLSITRVLYGTKPCSGVATETNNDHEHVVLAYRGHVARVNIPSSAHISRSLTPSFPHSSNYLGNLTPSFAPHHLSHFHTVSVYDYNISSTDTQLCSQTIIIMQWTSDADAKVRKYAYITHQNPGTTPSECHLTGWLPSLDSSQ